MKQGKIFLLIIVVIVIVAGATLVLRKQGGKGVQPSDQSTAVDKDTSKKTAPSAALPDTDVSSKTTWIRVGTKNVTPKIVYNGELYGRTSWSGAHKLENGEWVPVIKTPDTASGIVEVNPTVVYKNELYGSTTFAKLYRLVDNQWREVTKKITATAAFPIVVANNALYGDIEGRAGRQTYRLVGDEWMPIGKNGFTPLVAYNGELYGKSLQDDSYGLIYKLINNTWIHIGGTTQLDGLIVYNNELYGFYLSNVAPHSLYKLVGNEWVPVEVTGPENAFKTIEPKIVYKNELYGFDHKGFRDGRYKTSALYKLMGNRWVSLGVNIVPSVIYNDELYGDSLDDGGAYKMVGE